MTAVFTKSEADKSPPVRVVNGPYAGKRAFFQTSSAYVWGHHLARANLMYNIRAGDVFRVEVAMWAHKVPSNGLYFGPKVIFPVRR